MTVFAPTNEAFRKLRDRFRGRYPKDLLKEMIQYHVIYKVTPSETLSDVKLFQTSLQLKELDDRMQSVRITKHNGKPLLNGHARLQETDLGAINGLIHAIDEVLIPPPEINKVLLRTPSLFSTMSAALQRTGLDKKVQESSALTAFIPTNQAFRNLGCRALNHLFSKDGEKDLRKLVEYHFSNKFSYSLDMLNE
ncbi:FAS1 domain-containing protein, partial [Basidiobolus meristosporus CBS 931.73]